MRCSRVIGVLLAGVLGSTLTGCAAPPPNPPRDLTQDAAQDAPLDGRMGTGLLVSADGQTSGEVRVTLEELVDGYGDEPLVAHLEFAELHSPHTHLGVYGGFGVTDDLTCLDTEAVSGAGNFDIGEASSLSPMPATRGDALVQEVFITVPPMAEEHPTCVRPVAARADIVWEN